MITRRKFVLKSALAAGVASLGFPHIAKSASTLAATPGQKPRRIIHMVADGMSMGTFTCADYLSKQVRRQGLSWIDLIQNPAARSGLMNMRSLNSMVTDSSAASSSWGSGSRVKNGVLNQLPSGRKLATLCQLFGEKGWKRGLVTTTEITHATPAGFAVCENSRDSAPAIAAQYLDMKIDVLLGGGKHYFSSRFRKDKRDLSGDYTAAGYQVIELADALQSAPLDKRWLGTFSDRHLPFTIDRMGDVELQKRVPSLANMTRRALDWLGRHDHFLLQVEGGRVDHAAHCCDAPAALRDMIAFDEAIGEVLEFQKAHPDTLVLITTDHGNGNMGVNGIGSGYSQSSPKFQKLAGVKASFAEILRQLRKLPPASDEDDEVQENNGADLRKGYVPSVKEVQEIILANTGYAVPDQKAGMFLEFLSAKGSCLYDSMNSDVAQLGQLLGNHIAVGWTGSAHTADFVPVTAVGPGAERFHGFIQNVDVFRHYTQLAGIDFKNPEEPMLADAGEVRGREENVAEYMLV
jgi:alkaline phosphatase